MTPGDEGRNAKKRKSEPNDEEDEPAVLAAMYQNIMISMPKNQQRVLEYFRAGLSILTRCNNCQRKLQSLGWNMTTCSHQDVYCQDCAVDVPCVTAKLRTFQQLLEALHRDEHKTLESVIKEAERLACCPVCLDPTKTKLMVLCPNGHGICTGCRDSLRTQACPVCRAGYHPVLHVLDPYSGHFLNVARRWLRWTLKKEKEVN